MAQRNIRPIPMPVIDIHHTHSLGKPACRDAVDGVARELSARFGLGDMPWDGDTIAFAVMAWRTISPSVKPTRMCGYAWVPCWG